jgi:hypothetical protein
MFKENIQYDENGDRISKLATQQLPKPLAAYEAIAQSMDEHVLSESGTE